MFKFGFTNDDTEDQTNDNPDGHTEEWLESRQICPLNVPLADNCKINSIQCGEFHIKYVCGEDVVQNLANEANTVTKAEQSHSDLITAVYEGGMKIWECTFDLLNLISEENMDFRNSKVLDLGCGAGLVGIVSVLKGAHAVFQDYNTEVIDSLTIPNVALNKIDFNKCSFYCGDWKSFLDLYYKEPMESEKFDYIFTSETIYNVNNYKKLLNIFRHLLKKTGIIYLAAKCHYFGVGGGIRHFEDALKMEDIFDYSTCWACQSGVKREIIKITLKYS